jgi:hypothetical protein
VHINIIFFIAASYVAKFSFNLYVLSGIFLGGGRMEFGSMKFPSDDA